MKRIKRLFLILVTLVCVLGLSVSSFARTVYNPSDFPILAQAGDHYKIDKVIGASNFGATELSFWKEFMGIMSGAGSDAVIPLIIMRTGTDSAVFKIALVEGNYRYSVSGSSYRIESVDGVVFRSMSIFDNSSSSNSNWGAFYYGSLKHIVVNSGEVILWGSSGLASLPDAIPICNLNRIEISDDLNGEPSPPEPDEPDESVPDIPPPPPYNPTPPVIPKGNEYVLYDTDVWNTAIGHIKKNVGSATNIGLLIFMFIMIWSIFTRIFRNYTKPH